MNCCDEYGDCRQGRDCPVRLGTEGVRGKTFKLWQPPPVVGYWALKDSNTRGKDYLLPMTRKPAWFIRQMWRLCFGLEWIDEKPQAPR